MLAAFTTALKYQALVLLRVHNVYWAIPERAAPQLGRTLAQVSHAPASPTPRGKAEGAGLSLE